MKFSKKAICFNLIFFILIFLFTTLLAEIGMRIYHQINKKDKYIYIPDYYLGYVHSKNNKFDWWGNAEHPEFYTKQRTNSFGLMGKEVSLKKPDNVYRILIMGDSITEAMQVEEEEKFTSQLEILLNKELSSRNKKIEVINAGIRGYSPISHYLYFKRELSKLNPDLVILQIFSNDVFEDNSVKVKSIMDEKGLPLKINRFFSEKFYKRKLGGAKFKKPYKLIYSLHEFLLKVSRLYEYCYLQMVKLNKKSQFYRKMKALPKYNDAYQFFIIQDHDEDKLFEEENVSDRMWEDTKRYLLSLKNLVESNNAEFMILYVPIEAQLKLKKYGENSRLYFPKQANKNFNRLLNEMSSNQGILFLDLLDNFERNKDRGLYYNWDGHLTNEGHKLVSNYLFLFLKENCSLKSFLRN